MEIYIIQTNQRFGPFFIEQIIQFFYEGRLAPHDLIWHPGSPAWTSVATFFQTKQTQPQVVRQATTLEQVVAKREQLKHLVTRLQCLVDSRNAQRFQIQLDEISTAHNESLWFVESRANTATELKHQNHETLRQIAEYERQIAQLDTKIERTQRGC